MAGASPHQGSETRTCHPLGRDEGSRARPPLAKVRVDRACCLHGEDGSHLVQGGDQDPDLADAGCEQQGPRRLPVGFAVAEDLGADYRKRRRCQGSVMVVPRGPGRGSSAQPDGAGPSHAPSPGRARSPPCTHSSPCAPQDPHPGTSPSSAWPQQAWSQAPHAWDGHTAVEISSSCGCGDTGRGGVRV